MLQEINNYEPDNLFSASHQVCPAIGGKVTIASGVGKLSRGAILAVAEKAVKEVSHDTTASGWPIQSQVIAVAKASAASTLLIEGTDYKVSFDASSMGYLVEAVASGALDSYTGDLAIYTENTSADGEIGLFNGINKPVAVLAENIDATTSDVEAAVYFTGEFNGLKLSADEDVSIKDHLLSLAKANIFVRNL